MLQRIAKAAPWLVDRLILCVMSVAVLRIAYISYSAFSQIRGLESGPSGSATEPTRTGEQIYRRSWQEPFDYEVKVYASEYRYISENEEDFFKSAQLLWHIPSLSLADKYPRLAHRATVKIPETVLHHNAFERAVHAHVFIQRAGKFTPDPDITDPDLVCINPTIVWWHNPQLNRGWKGGYSDDIPLDLVVATALPISIVLEDQGYTTKNLPSHLRHEIFEIPWYKPRDGTYRPSIDTNQHTRSPVHYMPKVVMRSDERADGPRELTVEIDLELEGIRRAWVILKEAALRYTFPTRDYKYFTLNLRDLLVAEGYNVDDPDDEYYDRRPLAMIERVSMPYFLIVGILGLIEVLVNINLCRVLLKFNIRLKNDNYGVSFAMAVVITIANALPMIYNFIYYGSIGKAYFTDKVGIFFYGGLLFSLFFKRTTDNNDGPTEATDAAQNMEKSRAVQTEAIRKLVDKRAFKWLYKLLVPVLVSVSVHALVAIDTNKTQSGFVFMVVKNLSGVLHSIAVMPQIIVNYQTKSGSHFPIAIVWTALFNAVLPHLYAYFGGSIISPLDDVSPINWVEMLCLATMLSQWVIYRTK
ncbi:hypothetical protein FB645_003155 [Coemansia sp. IMI 203386]|nr:hypothetical protein FB645_003155 [Coemansia sp. IMI 203386]